MTEKYLVYFDDEQGTEQSHTVMASYVKLVDGTLVFMGKKWPRDVLVAAYATWKRFGAEKCLRQPG